MDTSESKTTIFSDIIHLIPTKYEADHFLIQLDAMVDSLFSIKSDIKTKMKEVFPAEKRTAIEALCQKNNIDIMNYVTFQRFLLDLKEYISHLPVIQITLAFEPKETTVQRISSWFSYHMKQTVLVNISTDRRILGGSIIAYNGKYLDYTLQKILGEKFEAGLI